ncbi:copper resistance protein CopC [Streptomyces boninensis]|uniref:copper resistance protein CopC n=1 Tax=Streptomyces boninensis TaxID=2039455 RepID=UPI003B20CAA5
MTSRIARRRPRIVKLAATVLTALLCALAGGLFGATPAAAHAALTGTDPKDGSVVQTAPKDISLSFSEGVQLSDDSVRVLDPKGRDVAKGEPHHVGGKAASAAVALHSGLPEGTYTVAWKAVSADSHPVAGAFTFSIGKESKTSVTVGSGASDSGVKTLYDTGRYIAYGGFVLMVGGCVFTGWCGGRSPMVRRLAAGGWVLLFAATVALLLLRGPYTGAGFGLTETREVLATRPGAALLSRLLLLGAAAVFLSVLFGSYERSRAGGKNGRDTDRTASEQRDLAYGLGIGGAVVAAGLAATWAMAEHASAGIQPWLAMPVTAIHLLAVAVWLGGLAALAVSMRSGPPVERKVVQRFSQLAFGSVLVLVATGLYQAWRGVGSWGALTSTRYGQLLLVKVGLVAVLVGVAWISRRWTARLGEAGAVPAQAEATAKAGERDKAAEPVKAAAKTGRGRKDSDAEADADAGSSSDSDSDAAAPDRRAQLARQRAAVEAARERRARDADPNRSGLRKSVLVEVAIALILLSVTTVLTGTQPGRAETDQQAGGAAQSEAAAGPVTVEIPYDTGGQGGKGKAELTMDPARAGTDNTLHVYLTNDNGELVDAPEVKVSFRLPAKDLGPLTPKLGKADAGHWSAAGVQLPMAGEWEISLTVRTSDVDQVTETKKIKIS